MYTPLRISTEYSLLLSSIRTKEIIQYCKKNHINIVAVTNSNNLFGSLTLSDKLKSAGIKPIIGCQLKVNDGFIWAYCKNEAGYLELSNLLTKSYMEHAGILNYTTLLCLQNCFIIVDHTLLPEQIKFITQNLDAAIAITKQKRYKKQENNLIELSVIENIPLVAAPHAFYATPEQMLGADALRCIKNCAYLAQTDRDCVYDDEYLFDVEKIYELFADIPWAIENSNIIGQKCNFILEKHAPRMPEIDDIADPVKFFEDKVKSGLKEKLDKFVLPRFAPQEHSKIKIKYQDRIDYEVDVIMSMGFCEYFLIVSDIVSWAKKNDIPVGPGRGSGASSLVAWVLKITNVDPIRFNLLFERFLNSHRVSLPDFDIDFCQEYRHKVIDYIQKRFGKDNVAHIMTFGSLQYRSALRDIGRVMQLPYSMIDELCKKLPQPVQGTSPSLKDLREKGELKEIINEENKELFMIAESIEGISRHCSVHAAGIVIGNTKLSNIIPLYKDADLEMPIIQLAMKEAEQIGLVKFDILGLMALSILRKTCELLKNRNITLDLDNLPFDDEQTFKTLQKGLVKSVFQMDSPGFKHLMIEMKPTEFNDLIAAGALYRPGPMADIPQFVKSKNGVMPITYLYPEMEPILKETYGVIVYQEQVLEIAKTMAGYSLQEADLLRRAMGKKIKSEMIVHEKKFIDGILKICGKEREKAQTLFDNLMRFSSYGFNKGHATPYGLITYQTAYCKTHYRAEFLCASMIYEQSLEKCASIIQEAEKLGTKVLPPCLNKSLMNFSILNDEIIFGLSKIKGVGDIANSIISDREQNGLYKSISEFIKRINPNKKVLENFVYAGVFDCFGDERSKQFEQIKNPEQEDIISLFDFQEESEPWDWLETAKNEFKTMNMIFDLSGINYKLKQYNIHAKMDDIEHKGYIVGLGIKQNMRKTKDGYILHSFQFFDQNGMQEILSPDDLGKNYEWQKVIIEVDKSSIRYSIRKFYTLDAFLEKYRKVFLELTMQEKDSLNINLKSGNTSIYAKVDDQTFHLGDYKLDLDFLLKQNIQFIA